METEDMEAAGRGGGAGGGGGRRRRRKRFVWRTGRLEVEGWRG